MKGKFKLIGLLLIGILLLVGCSQPVYIPPANTIPPATTNSTDWEATHTENTWISPAKVQIGQVEWTCPEGHKITTNMPRDWAECKECGVVYAVDLDAWIDKRMYPGARAEWDLRLHNGNDAMATFAIKYRVPDYTEGSYVKAPTEAESWVIITDNSPVLMPYETRNILIALEIPINATITADNWEFWISVKETSQGGTVQTELCSRWLVAMR